MGREGPATGRSGVDRFLGRVYGLILFLLARRARPAMTSSTLTGKLLSMGRHIAVAVDSVRLVMEPDLNRLDDAVKWHV